MRHAQLGPRPLRQLAPAGGKPGRSVDDVELATATWVACYNRERLHGALGYLTPAEHEAALTGTSPTASQPTPALATN